LSFEGGGEGRSAPVSIVKTIENHPPSCVHRVFYANGGKNATDNKPPKNPVS